MATTVTKIEALDRLQGLTPLFGGKVVTINLNVDNDAVSSANINDGDVTMKTVPIWGAVVMPTGVIATAVYPASPGQLAVTFLNKSGGTITDFTVVIAYVLFPTSHLFVND